MRTVKSIILSAHVLVTDLAPSKTQTCNWLHVLLEAFKSSCAAGAGSSLREWLISHDSPSKPQNDLFFVRNPYFVLLSVKQGPPMKDEGLIRRRVGLATTTRLWGIKNWLSSFLHPSLHLSFSLSLSPLAEPAFWKCHRWTLSRLNSNVLRCSSVILTTEAIPASSSGGHEGMF